MLESQNQQNEMQKLICINSACQKFRENWGERYT